MKNNLINRIFNLGGMHDGVSRTDFPEELVTFAQDHLASDFPNPNRRDCPPSEELRDLIHKGEFANEELRAHLLSCSECFRDYRSALIGRTSSEPTVVVARWNWIPEVLKQRPMPILVGLVLFFIMSGGLILIGYYDFRRTIPPLAGQESLKTARSTAPPINVQEPTSSPTKLKDESDRVGIARKETPAGISTERPRELIAANKVSIDLGSNNPLRSSGQTESPPIVLVSGPNQLEIKLQSGSPKGWYKVTLNDPFGNQIRPFVARAHNGTTLHANLNLKSVEPGKYLICVTRNTEVPECVPALVNAR